jgi:hypothetical protein
MKTQNYCALSRSCAHIPERTSPMSHQRGSHKICARLLQLVLVTLTFGMLMSLPIYSQVTGGTFTGRITDPSGAFIPNAQITTRDSATGVTVTTTTNPDGIYTVSNLRPATYEISVTAVGFQTAVQSGLTLTVGAVQVLNIAMRVGKVTEKLEITGEAPAIELGTSSLDNTVESATIKELPLNGRDWASLALLQPGVVQVKTQDTVSNPGGHARGLGMQMSIDGQRPSQNVYRINGIIVNDYSNAGPGNVLGANLGVDAIQEFSVLTSNYSSEYGYTSGGVINAITRSGTNQFHGNAYEFLRNSALDAPNFFDDYNHVQKPPFKRNQFGGSAGGPIKKEKIFIFGDYEGLRQNKGVTQTAFTPSPNARLGLLNDANGNPLPPITVDPNVQNVLTAFYPLPNAGLIGPSNNTGTYVVAGQQKVIDNFVTARGDVKFSGKDGLNSFWYYDRSSYSKPDALNTQLKGFGTYRQGASLEESHVVSNRMINNVRLGYSLSTVNNADVAAIVPAWLDHSFGILPSSFEPQIASVNSGGGVGGVSSLPTFNTQGNENFTGETFQVYDDASYIVGTHNLKFGAMFLRDHEDVFFWNFANGTVSFSTLADFLQDIPFKAQSPGVPPFVTGISPHHNRASIIAGYIQDDWQKRPGLTINLGLRYEMSTIPTETDGKIQVMKTLFTNPGNCQLDSHGNANCPGFYKSYFQSNPTTKNFEPRIGFSWDPFRSGKTAVRGGFGIFDALPLPYELALNNAQTSPFTPTIILTNPPQGSFPHGLANLFLGCPTCIPPSSSKAWQYVQPNPKRNYILQYNLNIQRQVASSNTVTLAYAGARAFHNPFQTDEFNTVFPFKTSAGWLFPNPVGSGVINPSATSIVPGQLINANVGELGGGVVWTSQSWYDSLEVRWEQRMRHGLQWEASFTWGKALDTSSGSFAGDNYAGDVTPTIPWWDPRITKGPADFDLRRNLVLNGLWQVPAPSLSGLKGWIAGGWEVGSVIELQDGVPIWPLDGIEGDPMGQLNSEPLAIPDRVCSSMTNPGRVQYLKANCLINAVAPSLAFYNAAPPFGCDHKFPYPTCINLLGNLGRNSIIGPGLVNVDFSLVKNDHIKRVSENFNIQFRAEFFNILNHVNFAPPISNLEAIDASGNPVPGFGQITTTQTDSREIQFGVKIIW